FVMKKEGLEFPDALRLLAQRAGVALRERRQSEEEDRQRERLLAANEAAAQWYRHLLLNSEAGQAARDYLERRGVEAATAEAFLLGYSPAAWEAAREHLRERGFSDAEQLAAGLQVEGEQGPSTGSGQRLHDRFRGRLMFPIRDARGRVIGFGARALDEALPKYLNTPQTALFDKSGTLYALDRAQAGIRREGKAVIVEGYMDAIAAHQRGFDNVVASMGTALTERQVRLLKRLSRQIVLALDADAAGGEAAVRGTDVVRDALAGEGDVEAVPVVTWRGLVRYQEAVAVDLRVAVLPPGSDPDDVIRADPDAWRTLVEAARPVLDYRLDASAAAHDLSDPKGRSQLVQEFLPLLATVADPVVRAHYLQRLSRLALVSERDLTPQLARQRTRKGDPDRRPAAFVGAPAAGRADAREEFLLALLLRYPALRQEALDVPDELLWESENREVLGAWRGLGGPAPATGSGQALSASEGIEAVKAALPEELAPHLERLVNRRLPSFDLKEAREALLDCLRRLERRRLEAEKQASAALLSAWEQELGPSVGVGTAAAAADDERVQEAVSLHVRDMEMGLRLHQRERNESGPTDRDGANVNG
ncbi:MAG TPA: DNA primase, partial [Dehalococcoidia bacterium]|nr:DNA primase [Dehalococcoidia bacterium]